MSDLIDRKIHVESMYHMLCFYLYFIGPSTISLLGYIPPSKWMKLLLLFFFWEISKRIESIYSAKISNIVQNFHIKLA